MTEKRGMTPAALGTLLNNDRENFLAAFTPGGIEAQEARGQQAFVASDTLPIQGTAGLEAKLIALGFVLGDPVDGIFIQAKLPPGWSKRPTDHSMWSDLLDAGGNLRAGIFYKAAFYDRNAHIQWQSPVEYSLRLTDGRKYHEIKDGEGITGMLGIITHKGKEVFRTEARPVRGDRERFKVQDALWDEVRAWIGEHYPQANDPFACWD